MKHSFASGMTRATALTRAGKLDEATALIQSLLNGTSAPVEDSPNARDDVIEGSFTHLDEPAAKPKKPCAATAARPARKRLGATLRDLASSSMPHMQARPAPAPDMPPHAQFLSLTHASARGNRDYRLYVPANLPAGKVPLIVMMHGCTQTPEDFASGTGMNHLAEEIGFIIAWPAQTNGANMQKCWNWYRPEDQARDRGEPGVIAGIVADIVTSHDVDPARIYIAGLSAGGAIAAIMGATYPDVFAAVGVHSGLPAGAARDLPSAFSAMRSGGEGASLPTSVPTIVFHGLADSTVHPSNGDAVIAQSLGLKHKTKRSRVVGTSDGGRSYRLTRHASPDGTTKAEHWEIDGAGHAWAGGHSSGSYTDPHGPNASREMVRFFLQHSQT